MAAKPKTDAFGDLLGSGFNPKKPTESKSLKNMKSNQDIANSLDPEKARVMSDIFFSSENVVISLCEKGFIGSLNSMHVCVCVCMHVCVLL